MMRKTGAHLAEWRGRVINMTGLLFVGAGGAVGAMLRYAISLIPYKGRFPLLTLFINVIGALAIGIIAGLSARKNLPQNAVLFLKTGVCGGFTTFSTFSLEAYNLLEQGYLRASAVYIILSVVCCLAGVAVGMYMAEHVL